MGKGIIRKQTTANKRKFALILLLFIFIMQLSYTLNNLSIQGYTFINSYTIIHNDNNELYGPSENLIKNGFYSIDNITPYTDRIPGITAVYLPLRFIFNQNTSFTILTLIPLATYIAIVIILFNYLFSKVNLRFAFLTILALLVLTPYSSFPQTTPEGHATVYTMIAFLFLFRVFKLNARLRYFWSGFFFMLAVTFRGYLLPAMLAVSGSIFIIELYTNNPKRASILFLLFILPLSFYLGIWSIRNYITTSEVIILQKANRPSTSPYKQSIQTTKSTFKQMGFETVEFYPNSPINYIMGRDSLAPENFNTIALSFGIDKAKIDSLRTTIKKSFLSTDEILEQRIISINLELQNTIKANTPLAKRLIIIPIKNFYRAYSFNFTSGWGLPSWSNANPIEKSYRLLIWLTFHVVMLYSVFISAYSIAKKQNYEISFLWLSWLAAMFFSYTFLINQIEFKYFLTLFPLSVIVSSLLTVNFVKSN